MTRFSTVAGVVLIAVAALVPGCSGPSANAAATAPIGITVFAASSLRDAVDASAAAYETATPWVEITLATDSSATLRTQIEAGAPADLFLSADVRNAELLAAAGLSAGPPVAFAGNALAIVAPGAVPLVDEAFDLATPGVRVVAAGEEVPITRYAAELVSGLGSLPDAPAGFIAGYERNVVSREDNVSAVLAKVELGEADAGIVYATDARASGSVRVVPVPEGAAVTVTYAGVVIRASRAADAASAFLRWLHGDEGQAVLARFGFTAVD